jgi:acetyl esterase/lipase
MRSASIRRGVPAELHVYVGAPHGFHIAAEGRIARRSARDIDDWLVRQLGGC